jgi:hypothetical protein
MFEYDTGIVRFPKDFVLDSNQLVQNFILFTKANPLFLCELLHRLMRVGSG